jgi:hypothetical protein
MSRYRDSENDPSQMLWERERRRERLLSAIRGWLMKKSSPRWKMAGMLVVCAAFAFWAAWFAAARGAALNGPAEAVGVLAAWPLLVVLLRCIARIESQRINSAEEWTQFAYIDRMDAAHIRTPEQEERMRQIQRGIDSGIRSGMQQGQGGEAVAVLLLLGILTMGVWLVYSLIRQSAAILAGIILDGEIIPAHQREFMLVPTSPWYKETVAATGAHFLGLLLSIVLLAYLIPFINYAGSGN